MMKAIDLGIFTYALQPQVTNNTTRLSKTDRFIHLFRRTQFLNNEKQLVYLWVNGHHNHIRFFGTKTIVEDTRSRLKTLGHLSNRRPYQICQGQIYHFNSAHAVSCREEILNMHELHPCSVDK